MAGRKKGRVLCFLRSLVCCLILAAVLGSSPPGWAQPLKTVRFAFPALSGAYLPIWVAKKEGIFRKYGLDVTIYYIAGNNRLTAAMIGGSIDIGVGGSASVDANARGATNLVFVAALADRAVVSLYARPGIKTVADLKGKTIATTGKATLTDDAAHIILEHDRVSPDRVKFVYTHSVSASLTTLLSGNVAAAILSAPGTLVARKAGMVEIGNADKINYPYLHGSIVVLRSYLKSHRETLKSFLRGLVDGIHASKSNPERAMAVMAKYLKNASHPALFEAYKTFTAAYPDRPVVPLQAIRDVVALHHLSLNEAAIEHMVDNSLIREVLSK